MSYHFDRDDVDLQGLSKFFKKSSDKEREHAQMFLKLQNQRGGRIKLRDIKAPAAGEWNSGLDAMEDALALEKKENQALLALHVCASSHNDPQLTDLIEGHFLTDQVKRIKELAGYVTNLKRVGQGLGEFQFDKSLVD